MEFLSCAFIEERSCHRFRKDDCGKSRQSPGNALRTPEGRNVRWIHVGRNGKFPPLEPIFPMFDNGVIFGGGIQDLLPHCSELCLQWPNIACPN